VSICKPLNPLPACTTIKPLNLLTPAVPNRQRWRDTAHWRHYLAGNIPTCRDRKVQRSVDHAIYRQRNLIERFFNKLKHFRRVATRYDKTARKSSQQFSLLAPDYGLGSSP